MKNWPVFFACLLASFGFWLVMMLSRSNSDVETIPVIAVSNLDGYSAKSADIVDIAARCKASGFELLMLNGTRKPVEVKFSSEDMLPLGEGAFEVNPSALYKYSKDIFGPGVTVESFVTPEVKFTFNDEICKKVPVIPTSDINCLPQYMLRGEVQVFPDSVLVYGDPKLIETISALRTKMISRDGVRNDLHGVVKIDVPAGVRISDSEVSYSVGVCRFVEFRREVKVAVHNVSEGSDFSVFPGSVEVVVKAEFPMKQNPFDVLEFYVDYQDFETSLTGQCVIRLANAPKGVISWTAKPEICNCIVQQ